MKLLTIIAFLFSFCFLGCTKEEVKDKLCDTGKTAASIVAAQVSVELSCQNVDAIKTDIENKLISLKICEAAAAKTEASAAKGLVSTQSVVAEALCTPVIEGLFAGGVSQLPSAWGCTGGPLAAEAKAKLIAACSKAF